MSQSNKYLEAIRYILKNSIISSELFLILYLKTTAQTWYKNLHRVHILRFYYKHCTFALVLVPKEFLLSVLCFLSSPIGVIFCKRF